MGSVKATMGDSCYQLPMGEVVHQTRPQETDKERLLEWARDVQPQDGSRITFAARRILEVIASYADYATGRNAFPSQATIAERAGCHVATVARSVPRLVEAGLMAVGKRRGVVGHHNIYHLNVKTAFCGATHEGEMPDTSGLESETRSQQGIPDSSQISLSGVSPQNANVSHCLLYTSPSPRDS